MSWLPFEDALDPLSRDEVKRLLAEDRVEEAKALFERSFAREQAWDRFVREHGAPRDPQWGSLAPRPSRHWEIAVFGLVAILFALLGYLAGKG